MSGVATSSAPRNDPRNRSAKLSESALNPRQRKFDFSSILPSETGIEVNFRPFKNPIVTNALQAIHQNGAVISFREYDPRESGFGQLGERLKNLTLLA